MSSACGERSEEIILLGKEKSNMLPIFVISLTRSIERRASITKQMKRLELEFEFIDAVDGKEITNDQLNKVDFDLARNFCGHDLSINEVGCALSHILLYEQIVKESIDKCIILEDDIYINSSFKKIINDILKVDKSEILFLHHGKAKCWPLKNKLTDGYRLAKYIAPSKKSKRGIISTAGYVLTYSGAKKLLSISYPVRMPADYLTGRLQLNGLSASGVEPSCLDVDLFPSTIDDRKYGQHLQNLDIKA